jgi:hypothetical protein
MIGHALSGPVGPAIHPGKIPPGHDLTATALRGGIFVARET